MPTTKELITIPSKVKYYAYTKVLFPIFLFSIFMSIIGFEQWFILFLMLLIIIGLPVCTFISIFYSSISFQVETGKITIYSGIFTKQLKAIFFDKIQNVTCTRGPLMQMFGVSTINIWTASPEQINVGVSHTPDGSLLLTADLTEWLEGVISKK